MAKMTVDRNFFSTHAEVMEDIAKTGFWPTTYVSGASPELPIHHHDYDIIGYCVAGGGYVLDGDNKRVEITAGDRLNIPKGAPHAEGEVTGSMTYIVTVREPVGLMTALTPIDPKGPMPDLSQLNIQV